MRSGEESKPPVRIRSSSAPAPFPGRRQPRAYHIGCVSHSSSRVGFASHRRRSPGARPPLVSSPRTRRNAAGPRRTRARRLMARPRRNASGPAASSTMWRSPRSPRTISSHGRSGRMRSRSRWCRDSGSRRSLQDAPAKPVARLAAVRPRFGSARISRRATSGGPGSGPSTCCRRPQRKATSTPSIDSTSTSGFHAEAESPAPRHNASPRLRAASTGGIHGSYRRRTKRPGSTRQDLDVDARRIHVGNAADAHVVDVEPGRALRELDDVVSLAQARAWVLDNKLAVKRGEDPFAGPQRSTVPTLRKIAGKVADSNRARLSSGEHKARAATLERHATELLDLPVDRVGKPEVLRASSGCGHRSRAPAGSCGRRSLRSSGMRARRG